MYIISSSSFSTVSSPFWYWRIQSAGKAPAGNKLGFAIPCVLRYARTRSKVCCVSPSSFLRSSSLLTTKINLSFDCFPPTAILSATRLSKVLSSSVPNSPVMMYKTNAFEDFPSNSLCTFLWRGSRELFGPGVSIRTRATSSDVTNGMFPDILIAETFSLELRRSMVWYVSVWCVSASLSSLS